MRFRNMRVKALRKELPIKYANFSFGNTILLQIIDTRGLVCNALLSKIPQLFERTILILVLNGV
jgi:hypothetical protein